MSLRTRLTGLVCCLALSACAATPITSHQGVLHLKGNAPFVYPILEERDGRQWRLEGLSTNTAEQLQNQREDGSAALAGH
ncbi:MAG: hypothetical protein CGU28_01805 [Candidatus Dactylopiibacterium carminicum]|uniref:Uncharacterized protein n=1 Tax=Candidatus Dactylopiibacterium carminicum TaxID=857335 RepID=A0A272ETC7_9RHOO|nr:hypothetical protein [Candidatus Dactylopiibacterium carminicum]KAF7599354.1 hypothetical protein BGI27_08300 [Candidatus Dactylopiibacterium carminicum]PAS93364.1 MAG: hypothetical protein CGU29_07950 [Candidatus Dactylopiibacterium carminicum]PAS98318.1 MAG: hypothetical protein CGU28_01805 [Candidatus Dactylopiibacterium carminicum]PAS99361.1 MAG: hypothetical protein BSR46_08325 [Candidatus Dactylopiibacterium carminicum]